MLNILIVLQSDKKPARGGDIQKLSVSKKFQVILHFFNVISDLENIEIRVWKEKLSEKEICTLD
jgi:hypothetical protein